MNPKRVVLAMSGGVDSSVAAHLLLEQGYELVGVFMRHGEPERCAVPVSSEPTAATAAAGQVCMSSRAADEMSQLSQLPIVDFGRASKQGCCTAQDALDARRVADRLGIPFYAINLEADFRRIIDYFVDEYTTGRTPNPCVMCNNWVKFGKLFDYADSVDARYVATGHYARLAPDPDTGQLGLYRGVDLDKDQSYVLFGIAPARLPRMLLPVGDYHKPRIRELAAQVGLRVAEKRDSQEICFVAAGQHAEFIRARTETSTAGDLVTTDGRVVGQHQGIEGFTIGQRKGLGVAMGEPYFVIRIDVASRQVVIGRYEELARRTLTADQANWLVEIPRDEPYRCSAKIRYNSPPRPAQVTRLANDRLAVQFDEPCHGVAAGQAVVCYDQDRVVGGGWIESESHAGPPPVDRKSRR